MTLNEVYFVLLPGGEWQRHTGYVPAIIQYRAGIVLKLNEDGTGEVVKNRYKDEPRLSEQWTKDEMMMVALKSENYVRVDPWWSPVGLRIND